jgi:hypothetical protein
MKIDIQDIKFWMDAIRNSDDKYRTLESFWGGQLESKVWLIENLTKYTSRIVNSNIVIHGGWNGVLSSMLFNSELGIQHITSIDIDPKCQSIASTVNKRQEIEGKFSAITTNMTEYKYDRPPHVVINTSCEHITQEQYDQWLDNQPDDALLVIQSNNYFELEEHIRCAIDLNDFTKMSKLKPLWRGELETSKYTRYMIMGRKK